MRSTTFVLLLIVYFAFLVGTEAWWGSSSSNSDSNSDSKPSWSSVKDKAKQTWSSAKDTAKEAWSLAKDEVKETYHKANEWAKENPLAVAAIATGAGIALGKREGDPTDEVLLEALDKACPQFTLPPDAPLPAVVVAAFSGADENQDGTLSAAEFENFAKVTAILEYCEQQKKVL